MSNYQSLIAKWGEWEIVGANQAGLVVRYVNIGNALFSGLAITFGVLFGLTVITILFLDKLLFPRLIKSYEKNNEDLVNLTSLRTAEQIKDIEARLTDKKSEKPKGKEWF